MNKAHLYTLFVNTMEIRHKVVDIWDGHVRNVSLMPGVTYSLGGTYRVWFEERNDEKAAELFEKIFAQKLEDAQNKYDQFKTQRTFKEVEE